MMQTMSTRLNININDQTAEQLKRLAEADQQSVTEVVRRATSVYDFIHDAVRSGKDLRIHDGDEVTRIILT